MRPKRASILLVVAVYQKQCKQCHLMIESGARLDYVCSILDRGGIFSGKTALQVAVEGGDIDIVKLLLQKGADVNQRITTGSFEGATLFMYALARAPEIASLFLEFGGVDLSLAGASGVLQGYSTLAISCMSESRLMKRLSELGARFNRDEVFQFFHKGLTVELYQQNIKLEVARAINYVLPGYLSYITNILLILRKKEGYKLPPEMWNKILSKDLVCLLAQASTSPMREQAVMNARLLSSDIERAFSNL